MHWDPNRSAASAISAGRATAAVFSDTLSAPARSKLSTSATERTPPPTVSGMKTWSAVRRTTSYMVSRPPLEAVMSKKVSSSAPSASYRAASSTGSPASRRFSKLTPLTTRPPSTSRQGITRTARPVPEYISVVLPIADGAQGLEDLAVRAGRRGQHRVRRRGPRFAGQVGDSAAGGPHLRHAGGVVPHVATETSCGAHASVGDVAEVDR